MSSKSLAACLPLTFMLLLAIATETAYSQNWWQTNSLQKADTVTGVRRHAEGTFSVATTSGNLDSHLYQSAPAFFLRDGRFQLSLNGDLMFQRLKVGGMEVKNQKFDAYGRLLYDVSKHFQAEGGLQWEQDHSNHIDHRYTYYGGVIFNPVTQKLYSFKFFTGAGYQFLISTEDLPTYPRTEEHEPVVYIQQMLNLTPNANVKINQSFTYLNEFNDANTTRTVLTLKAQFPVTKYLSIVTAYTSKYQTQPTVPGAASVSTSRNATFTTGVKIVL